MILRALIAVLCLASAQAAPIQAAHIDALITRMTLAEKIGQLQSSAPAIPRLGIAAYDWWSEGLHGIARAGAATVYPQAIGLAASFDPELLHQVGRSVGEEAREKFDATGWHADHVRFQGLTIWSPNVNIFRDPRWGRGQETYGEDPYLSGVLGAAFIAGMQGPDAAHPIAAATVKHFLAHSGPEDGRYGMDADVSPVDLAETYEPAFHAAVRAGVAGVMCSYNAIGGTPNCANGALLSGMLRRDWGFRGTIVADCDAVMEIARFHHAVPTTAQAAARALGAGVDLDCGTAYAALDEAIRQQRVAPAALDMALHRLFTLRAALGWTPGTGDAAAGPYPTDTRTPARHALAVRAATESMVLLTNHNATLPLNPATRLALIGPNCDAPTILEANYHGTALDLATPLTALRTRFARVAYAQGSAIASDVPATIPETALAAARRPGLAAIYRTDGTVIRRQDRLIDMDWDHVPPVPGIHSGRYNVSWTGTLTVPAGGATPALALDRCFDCGGHDTAQLRIDGADTVQMAANATALTVADHPLAPGPHRIALTYTHAGDDQGIHLRWIADPATQRAEAREAIAGADVVLACVGLSPEVEGEALPIEAPGFVGGDRTQIELPAPQRALLASAFASGKPVVVLDFGGGAVALGDAVDKAAAILQLWYPGEAGGEALARVLAGEDTPSGRLPVTFYHATGDLMPFTDYDLRDVLGGRTYRYFAGHPDFPFGFGLGYGAPQFGATTLSGRDARATITNRGPHRDVAVAELYVLPPAGGAQARLAGIARVALAPGESRTVALPVPPDAFNAAGDDGTLHPAAGRYGIAIAAHAPIAGHAPAGTTWLTVDAAGAAIR